MNYAIEDINYVDDGTITTSIPPILPDSITVDTRVLQVGNDWLATFAITGYPRHVHPGWLQPLLTYPGRIDVSLYIDPVDPVVAAQHLKRQLAKLESDRRQTHDHGRLQDPGVDAAAEDAYELSGRIARGEGQLYRVGLYVTVHSTSQDAVTDEAAAVRALAASVLLDAKPTTYRSLQGWVSTLPFGMDRIGMRRSFDTPALAAAFPFTSSDLPAPDPASAATPTGVLYGFNLGSQSLVHHDRFALGNHNSVILGPSGSGKSYLGKLELLRNLYRGIDYFVIDPENEYTTLATAVGGTKISLGTDGVRMNPFDLNIYTRADGRRSAPRDAVVRQSLFIHTVINVLLGEELSAPSRALLDRAITKTYQQAGITSDSRTWNHTAPVLADLAATLADSPDKLAIELSNRLHPFTSGSFSGFINGSTSTQPHGHLIVFSLRDLADELKPLCLLLTLDAIWRHISNPVARKPRVVVVDEAWLLMKHRAGAEFLCRMAKASRRHWAGLTVVTQDIEDVLSTELGRAIVSNSASHVLLRQSSQAIDLITRTFDLSAGERQFLLTAQQGQGLLSMQGQRVAFQSLASPAEHALVTSDPTELIAQRADASALDDNFVDLGIA